MMAMQKCHLTVLTSWKLEQRSRINQKEHLCSMTCCTNPSTSSVSPFSNYRWCQCDSICICRQPFCWEGFSCARSQDKPIFLHRFATSSWPLSLHVLSATVIACTARKYTTQAVSPLLHTADCQLKCWTLQWYMCILCMGQRWWHLAFAYIYIYTHTICR